VWMSVYFGAIMVGRFAIGLVANRLGNRLLVRLGIGLSIVGVLLFMLNGPYALSLLALALVGLGFAPVYPSLMHETATRFAPDVARVVIGRQAGCAYVGAFFLPPLMGVIAGSVGLWVIMPTIAAMLVLLLLVTQWLDRHT
jgi:fucose permease